MICFREWESIVGTSGGWGSKGLVKVVGSTVGTGHGQGVHWSSKAVRVVLEALEWITNTVQDCHIAKG